MATIPGWTLQDISGVGNQAKIFRHDSGSDKASHNIYMLKGFLAVSVATVSRDVPDTADLSVYRYGRYCEQDLLSPIDQPVSGTSYLQLPGQRHGPSHDIPALVAPILMPVSDGHVRWHRT